jgi:hypothetical protein
VAAALARRADGAYSGRRYRRIPVHPRCRRYLHFAWRLFRYSLLVALLVFALMIIERVADHSCLAERASRCSSARRKGDAGSDRSAPSARGWFAR